MGSSAITEEMRTMLGVEIGPEVYEIEKGMIRKFAVAIEDANQRWQNQSYAETTKNRGIIAPPTFVMCICELNKQHEWLMSLKSPLTRLLNGGMEIESYKPVRPGDVISVTGKLIDLREKEGAQMGKMLFFVFERLYRNQNGDIVAKGRYTFIKY